jgi:hypothetical protein
MSSIKKSVVINFSFETGISFTYITPKLALFTCPMTEASQEFWYILIKILLKLNVATSPVFMNAAIANLYLRTTGQ